MKRRTVLALGGVGAGVPGGCFAWNWYQSPTIPNEMDVDTLYLKRDVLAERSSRDSRSLVWKEEYHTTIEDKETAIREFTDIGSVTSFIENTNFDSSYLILVQNGMQSDPDLVLEAITRTEGGLHLEMSIDAPFFGGHDDLIIHSLLLRIADAESDIPDTLTVDIEGYV